MKRFAPSSASSFDFNSNTAYPPTTSLASVKGPSVVVSCPRETRTRVLIAVGANPPLAIIVPFLFASSLSFAMASISSLGGRPLFSPDLTSIMNRIVTSPFDLGCEPRSRQYWPVEPGSNYASNKKPRNRQLERSLLRLWHTTTITTKPSWPSACLCPPHRSAEVRTHPRQPPSGNPSLIGWPLPWSLPEG